MINIPQNLKYKKRHKLEIFKIEYRASHVSQGQYALIALEGGFLTIKQIEAARRAIMKSVKRIAKLFIKIYPDLCLTKKPAEVRMGKGKGSPTVWVAAVRPGKTLFEITGIPKEKAEEVLLLGASKLPIKTKFVIGYNS